MEKFKFNFYSKIMLQTITVFGYMTQNWDKTVFKVDKVINNDRQSIISLDVHEEALEYFQNNESFIKASIDS